ncbi:histidine--tRNA ligase [Patescibacteria group bacterium]|nr:histidine--tRNA ligase [Patescibacteria group bacterium]
MSSRTIPKSYNMKEQGPLSGFRDMLAEQVFPRQAMVDTIKKVYEKYGFVPQDTPAIERYETLTGKYGPEGEKLMYKFKDHGGRDVALRYDLTVPLARIVFQYKDKITLPYKRYQVGNVWRGDRPQAGRYREFMQFDADIIGTSSPIADAEIVEMMVDTMRALGVDAVVRVNNRLILDGLAEKSGVMDPAKTKIMITAIDKSEKIGKDAVLAEISESIDSETAELVNAFLGVSGSDSEKLEQIAKILEGSVSAAEGVNNLQQVFSIVRKSGYEPEKVKFDQTIARGLDYYTGIIYETTLKDLPGVGSVCSGGRYDKLVSALSSGKVDLPAVGTSVGVDRLFSGLEQLDKVKKTKTASQVLVINFDSADAPEYVSLASDLRKEGIPTEVYYDQVKIGKQIKFANSLGIKFVIFLGFEEKKKNVYSVKNLETGEQQEVDKAKLIELLVPKIDSNPLI